MSDPQLPPVPPTAPNASPSSPPNAPQQQFPAPPAASALPAQPQYPGIAPQPPYGQPAQQAYGQPALTPHGQQAYGAPAAPNRSGSENGLARVAFIIALALAGISVLRGLTEPFFFSSLYSSGAYEAYTLVVGVLLFLGGAAALVLGIIAGRREGGKILSGIAIGVGGLHLLNVVIGGISSVFLAFS